MPFKLSPIWELSSEGEDVSGRGISWSKGERARGNKESRCLFVFLLVNICQAFTISIYYTKHVLPLLMVKIAQEIGTMMILQMRKLKP